MKVKLIHETRVRLSAGVIIEVDEREAERLRAFNVAEIVEEKAEKPKKKNTK